MNTKKQDILQISKELGLTHIGSNISVLPILEEIYKTKGENDKVILDNAHAHLAHLVVKESLKDSAGFDTINAKEYIKKYGIHCDRKAGCDASGGSLGHGLGIAIGYALAGYKVHAVVSDGSMMEGSNAEALRIAKTLGINNIRVYANLNGYTAVSHIDLDYLESWIKNFGFPVKFFRTNNGLPELEGLSGHYLKLND